MTFFFNLNAAPNNSFGYLLTTQITNPITCQLQTRKVCDIKSARDITLHVEINDVPKQCFETSAF